MENAARRPSGDFPIPPLELLAGAVDFDSTLAFPETAADNAKKSRARLSRTGECRDIVAAGWETGLNEEWGTA